MHVYIDACYGSVCSSCYRRTFRYLSMNVPIFIFGRCRLRDIAFCSCGIALSVVTGYPFCSYGISLSVVLGYIDFCNCYRCMFRHIYIDMHVQIYIYIYIYVDAGYGMSAHLVLTASFDSVTTPFFSAEEKKNEAGKKRKILASSTPSLCLLS